MTTSHTPAPVVPKAAGGFPHLRGRRVLVGVPGLGWRADLRADDPVVHGSRTYIPILTEQDYYRAETEQMEVFAPLVPIDRVWVEHIPDRHDPAFTTFSTGAGERQPVTLDAPPARAAVPALLAEPVMGRRLVQVVPDGDVRDLRGVTEVYRNAEGVSCVRVCGEAEWYRWALSGTTPSTVEVNANVVWLE